MQGYDEKDPVKVLQMTKKAADKLYAFIYLENADQTKYGSVLRNLNYEQSLGNNEYPDDITATTAVLSRHPFDERKKHEGGRYNRNRDNKINYRKIT